MFPQPQDCAACNLLSNMQTETPPVIGVHRWERREFKERGLSGGPVDIAVRSLPAAPSGVSASSALFSILPSVTSGLLGCVRVRRETTSVAVPCARFPVSEEPRSPFQYFPIRR